MSHSNGVVSEILDRSRERVADGSANDNDRLIVVMEALNERNRNQMDESLNKPTTIRMFGRNFTMTEIAFLFGATIAGEAGLAIVIPQLLGG